VRVSEIIDMCGARNPKAVQVGGPSGTCVAPEEYDRTICYGDLSTGGSIIMIGQQRDLLEIVSNFVDFFVNESCGSCVPCRVGNQILKSNLAKVRAGKAVQSDVDEMLEVGATMKCASRCGLGQTAANPVMTTIRNFPQEYESRLVKDDGFEPAFDLSAAVSESCAAAGRDPNLHPDCR
jgi:[NiFe] hydrogenase diaphorase moiety large subunit